MVIVWNYVFFRNTDTNPQIKGTKVSHTSCTIHTGDTETGRDSHSVSQASFLPL